MMFAFVLTGCDWKFWQEDTATPEAPGTFAAKMPVVVSPAKLDTLTIFIYASGTLFASRKADILSETSGRISEVFIEEDRIVNEDEVIAQIDIDELFLEEKRLNLEKDKALGELSAWKAMDDSIDEEQLKIRTGLKEIEIELEKLRLQIERAQIKAPFTGTITDFNLEKGMYVSTGSKIASIYDLRNLNVDVRILESEITRIEIGQPAVIQFPGRKGKLYYGRIESIAPFIDRSSRTCRVRVRLVNDGYLREGMYAEVKIGTKRHADKILIPKDALLVRDGRKLVFAAEEGKAKWQYVETGLENNALLEITDGVLPDQQIIIDGHFSLSHDANIEVTEVIPYEKFRDRF